VLEKQPDSAGEPLRKPEETAGARFKNVQLLKDLPASQLLDTMRTFNMSLGVTCEHCHVQGNFAADEKPAKPMARKMITMTRSINDQTFAGKNEVRCFTCHRGQMDPQSRPAF
jgi:Photosynthetic reaction centre cytochrome C subunit.